MQDYLDENNIKINNEDIIGFDMNTQFLKILKEWDELYKDSPLHACKNYFMNFDKEHIDRFEKCMFILREQIQVISRILNLFQKRLDLTKNSVDYEYINDDIPVYDLPNITELQSNSELMEKFINLTTITHCDSQKKQFKKQISKTKFVLKNSNTIHIY